MTTAFQPCVGQMYVVRTRAEFKVDRTIEKRTLILQARSRDEIEPKLRYYIDLSVYAMWRIVSIEKVRDHVHTTSRFLIPLDPSLPESFRLETPADQPDSAGGQRTNLENGRVFAIGVAGRVNGHDRNFILRRVGSWLLRLGPGREGE